MTREKRVQEWQGYLEGVYTACLLAYGVHPKISKVGFVKFIEWRTDVTDYLYGRMNYSPCKSASRERQRVTARKRGLYREYLRWLRTHGGK